MDTDGVVLFKKRIGTQLEVLSPDPASAKTAFYFYMRDITKELRDERTKLLAEIHRP